MTWTDLHKREALRRTYELVAELIGQGRDSDAEELLEVPHNMAELEETWRADLGSAFSAERIEREVRRVHALAEGRLVRREGWGFKTGPEGLRVTEKLAARPIPRDLAAQTGLINLFVRRILRVRQDATAETYTIPTTKRGAPRTRRKGSTTA